MIITSAFSFFSAQILLHPLSNISLFLSFFFAPCLYNLKHTDTHQDIDRHGYLPNVCVYVCARSFIISRELREAQTKEEEEEEEEEDTGGLFFFLRSMLPPDAVWPAASGRAIVVVLSLLLRVLTSYFFFFYFLFFFVFFFFLFSCSDRSISNVPCRARCVRVTKAKPKLIDEST